ncbi:hypothetical protein CALVIDRAFT_421362 [Calocera viscosa TUFC12733]|uniref:Uncharacterized protein n=1 Tax=Calocera viscosa (strain TUFC12733) TaxID=1330018 RepID=A0A167PIE8_CALVF|nr:hypothetical protein CALVIDRAFT_421362 [Calocera viscosa TUFC12733]
MIRMYSSQECSPCWLAALGGHAVACARLIGCRCSKSKRGSHRNRLGTWPVVGHQRGLTAYLCTSVTAIVGNEGQGIPLDYRRSLERRERGRALRCRRTLSVPLDGILVSLRQTWEQ